jgi:HSP20 family protein
MLPVARNHSAWAPVASFPINRMDALLNRVFGEDGTLSAPQSWLTTPLAMWEDEDHFWIEAELPGVSEQDVEITVHNGTLIIKGERKPAEGRRYLYNARSFGRFERTITLPEAVDAEAVKAALKDGVLQIEIPKAPQAKPRKIEIKTS